MLRRVVWYIFTNVSDKHTASNMVQHPRRQATFILAVRTLRPRPCLSVAISPLGPWPNIRKKVDSKINQLTDPIYREILYSHGGEDVDGGLLDAMWRLVGGYQRFGVTWCLHLQDSVCSSETSLPTCKCTRCYTRNDHHRRLIGTAQIFH
jgi:hypothetical protein